MKQPPPAERVSRETSDGGAIMQPELVVAEQIARLFHRSAGTVWELVTEPARVRAEDITIRGADGTPVVYARPAA
jgi:hypothetical protein